MSFTERLRVAVRSEGSTGSLTLLDKDLDNAVERAFGALAQPCKGHGCDEATEQKLTGSLAW